MFDIIVATDIENGIGKEGRMPWDIPKDLTYFHTTTLDSWDQSKKNAVIMGRATWESIPSTHRPLENRFNIVISSTLKNDIIGRKVFPNFEQSLQFCHSHPKIDHTFVIGGQQLYQTAFLHPELRYIYQTIIPEKFDCDRFFPQIDETQFKKVTLRTINGLNNKSKNSNKAYRLTFLRWEKKTT